MLLARGWKPQRQCNSVQCMWTVDNIWICIMKFQHMEGTWGIIYEYSSVYGKYDIYIGLVLSADHILNGFDLLIHWCLITNNLRNVREMKGGRRRVNVLEILGAGFLKSMEWGSRVVFRESRVRLSFFGQLHSLMLGNHDSHLFAEHTKLVHVHHGWTGKIERG